MLAGDLYAAMRNHVRDGAADDPGYDPRWNAAARARLAEDTAHEAHRDGGVRQYVVLGAGLDSFAYRNPHEDLTVYEVDTPASQAWKRQRLADCGIEVPPSTRHVPCDFEVDDLEACLVAAGFRPDRPAVVAWLGVTYYLTTDAVARTLDTIAHWAGGTRLVLDYRLPQARWDDFPGWDPSLLRAMTAAVVASGERFPGELDHPEVTRLLARHGFVDIETFDHDDIRRTYMGGQVEPVPGPVPVLCLARATVPST